VVLSLANASGSLLIRACGVEQPTINARATHEIIKGNSFMTVFYGSTLGSQAEGWPANLSAYRENASSLGY
jgi:hypothetical protein